MSRDGGGEVQFSAYCKGTEISCMRSGYDLALDGIVATFIVFSDLGSEDIRLPFKAEDAPTIGKQYEIEVRPCK
jgi:hypothetical protein|nr:MAG TPA_asm: hypothetical protein [Caudoviricetes sp.]